MHGPVEIAPGVHGLGSEYVNWYLVEEGDRLTAVDAGLPAFRKTLASDLRAIGRHTSDVAAVVLTHSDADHTGVVPELREAGARVLIHSDDEDTLRRPSPKTGDANPKNVLPYLRRGTPWRVLVHMSRRGGARPPKVEGAETFADGAVLDVPGSPRVVHTPGHTPGHCVILFEGVGALFVGDALCTWNALTARRGAQLMPRPLNVDNERALESLARIEGLEARAVLPGHGDPLLESPAAAVAAAREAGPS
ncbi:MAG TPA: MBL fold metallo-hydrolase [Thermoleophilaceae bacterium]|nr:MBL fold metallo-hydrolase [Thermoleophilaceae bacterium]